MHAVALDFDGTVADSMGFLTELAVGLMVRELGLEWHTASRQYLATAGSDFETQLDELAPSHSSRDEITRRFEAEKVDWMMRCELFADVVPALELFAAAGIPVLLCSSTRTPLVHDFCERFDLLRWFDSVDGWSPGRSKTAQLTGAISSISLASHDVIFTGDSKRDASVARAAGTRFVGLVRAGQPDAFSGNGVKVVGSLSELATNVVRAAGAPVAVGARGS